MLEVLSGDYLRSKGLNQGDVAAYCFDGHSAHRTARQTGLAGLDVRVATARRGNSALAVSLRKESEDHLHPRLSLINYFIYFQGTDLLFSLAGVEDKLARYWLDKGPEERVARAHPRDEVFEQYAKVLDSIDGNDYWERAYNKYMRAPKQIFAQDYPYWDRKNPQGM